MFCLVVALVALGGNRARDDAGVCFDNHAIAVARLHVGDRDVRPHQPRGALEEHLPHRREVELLRAQRPGEYVRAPPVLLVAERLRLAVAVEDLFESDIAESFDVADIVRPRRRPADILHEPARLAEGEVDSRDPGPVAVQEGLEVPERRQVGRFQGAQHVAFDPTVLAGDGLPLAGPAGEIESVDVHA